MKTQINPLKAKTTEKISRLTTQTRLLWSKYDNGLKGTISGVPNVKNLLSQCFTKAGLGKDYLYIEANKNLLVEIVDIAESDAKAHSTHRKGIHFSQLMVIQLIKTLYDVVEHQEAKGLNPDLENEN